MKNSAGIPLYLFAKAPQPGAVKTRMQPHLSQLDAARLAEVMLEQSMQKVSAAWRGQKVLAVTPTVDYPLFARLCAEYQFDLCLQTGRDLGERMANAINRNLKELGGAVVMGCDVPHFPPSCLLQCHSSMLAKRHVVGAAVDGGFYLLGLATHCESLVGRLFNGLEWGGGTVFDALMNNARAHGVDFDQLPVLNDVDDYRDLELLADGDTRYECFVQSAK